MFYYKRENIECDKWLRDECGIENYLCCLDLRNADVIFDDDANDFHNEKLHGMVIDKSEFQIVFIFCEEKKGKLKYIPIPIDINALQVDYEGRLLTFYKKHLNEVEIEQLTLYIEGYEMELTILFSDIEFYDNLEKYLNSFLNELTNLISTKLGLVVMKDPNLEAEQVKEEKTNTNEWKCQCGAMNPGNFCGNCGKPKPTEWKCQCGAINFGNFCGSCGKPKPIEWRCQCGTINTGMFCGNCGNKKNI